MGTRVGQLQQPLGAGGFQDFQTFCSGPGPEGIGQLRLTRQYFRRQLIEEGQKLGMGGPAGNGTNLLIVKRQVQTDDAVVG